MRFGHQVVETFSSFRHNINNTTKMFSETNQCWKSHPCYMAQLCDKNKRFRSSFECTLWDFWLLLIIIIIPIYCCFPSLLSFPFLSMSSTLKSLKTNFQSLISLTSLLPTVPHAHSVYTSLLHASLFPIFCHLPFKFLKLDFKSLLTQKISL